jgi:hypothetical protein
MYNLFSKQQMIPQETAETCKGLLSKAEEDGESGVT